MKDNLLWMKILTEVEGSIILLWSPERFGRCDGCNTGKARVQAFYSHNLLLREVQWGRCRQQGGDGGFSHHGVSRFTMCFTSRRRRLRCGRRRCIRSFRQVADGGVRRIQVHVVKIVLFVRNKQEELKSSGCTGIRKSWTQVMAGCLALLDSLVAVVRGCFTAEWKSETSWCTFCKAWQEDPWALSN